VPLTLEITDFTSWQHADTTRNASDIQFSGGTPSSDLEDGSDATLVHRDGGQPVGNETAVSSAAGQPVDAGVSSGLPANAVITSITLRCRIQYTQAEGLSLTPYIRSGATSVNGASSTGSQNSWGNHDTVFATDANGAAWTRASIFTHYFGAHVTGSIVGTRDQQWTKMSIIVNYESPGGMRSSVI
jgi:hypothetical protein